MPSVQDEVFAFLADPANHPGVAEVRRIDTHGACVFLAGADAYKVKRAVRYPYMDFSTLERRHAACLNEIEVNRLNAPQLYRGVVPIRRRGAGLVLGGADGEVVEWAVHLARFDENETFDRLAARGALDSPLLAKLARQIAEAHRRAPVAVEEAQVAAFLHSIADTVAELRATAPEAAPLLKRLVDEAAVLRPLLAERCGQGFVRHCHGDLHLRNVVLIDGQPTLFDAIEFDDAIATCDVLFDLAFLLMDLWALALHAEANLLLNRYLWLDADSAAQLPGLAAMPLFLAERAAIRAKVALELAALSPGLDCVRSVEGERYLELAAGFLAPQPARLLAIGGLSGTGKSSLAALLAPELGIAPGALVLRSDIERKRLLGVDELDRLPESAYAADITTAVYQRLRRSAENGLRAGYCVIVDAVHLRAEERAAIAEVANGMGVTFDGIWLEARSEVLIDRVARRVGDASDATAAVVTRQESLPVGALDWSVIPADRALDLVAADARAALGRARRDGPTDRSRDTGL